MNNLTIDMECFIELEGTYNIDLSEFLELQQRFDMDEWIVNYPEILQQLLGDFLQKKNHLGEYLEYESKI